MLATRDCLWLSTCQMILLLNIFSTVHFHLIELLIEVMFT
ncbi:hypothetical protein Patl1_11231 [Pistacia atlantica]|uniref:Uncharacterized protein n=1 Tax=Pistacia atlantica TaxID=434234 RepID=A0ACC1A5E6_9ROSI|nr:hypothetical protein Patl1_11231 [Pistacia atlantica]